ncbi:MAG: hypothetical protein WCI73_02355 [Phycisphaerae bacterium]
MSQRFAIEMRLSDRDLRKFQTFLRLPSTTVDKALQWVEGRGYRGMSRKSVYNFGSAAGAAWTAKGARVRMGLARAGQGTPLADLVARFSPHQLAALMGFLQAMVGVSGGNPRRSKTPKVRV